MCECCNLVLLLVEVYRLYRRALAIYAGVVHSSQRCSQHLQNYAIFRMIWCLSQSLAKYLVISLYF